MATQTKKWFQQELNPITSNLNEQPSEEKPDLSQEAAKLVEKLKSQVEDPQEGVGYKIEVTGPLSLTDGSFWVLPLSRGFIQEKLEPLSKLLRSFVQADPSLNFTSEDGLICVLSPQNNLWMRGVVIKDIDLDSVKVQLIDVGRVETHNKGDLYKVPEPLNQIPHMSFCCMMFEKKDISITNEHKWLFNDLVSKQIINFTCEKVLLEKDDRKILIGQMKTIIDAININQKMKEAFENPEFINEKVIKKEQTSKPQQKEQKEPKKQKETKKQKEQKKKEQKQQQQLQQQQQQKQKQQQQMPVNNQIKSPENAPPPLAISKEASAMERNKQKTKELGLDKNFSFFSQQPVHFHANKASTSGISQPLIHNDMMQNAAMLQSNNVLNTFPRPRQTTMLDNSYIQNNFHIQNNSQIHSSLLQSNSLIQNNSNSRTMNNSMILNSMTQNNSIIQNDPRFQSSPLLQNNPSLQNNILIQRPAMLQEQIKSQKSKEAEQLTRIAGPRRGVQYEIEITSALNADGTFWACPLTSGFVRDKIEPMGDLLRASILMDQGLRNVQSFDQMICVQSKEYRCLMRGFVIKELDHQMVRVQLVDCGRIEEHLKTKIYRVPELLSVIPYMAFYCTLYDKKVKVSYEQRWKFADLCKGKIVNFIFDKHVVVDSKKLLRGTIQCKHKDVLLDVAEELERVMIDDND